MSNEYNAPEGYDGWIQTRFGDGICVVDPLPAQVRITDIAHALACSPRFTGHTFEPYSVAQHSVLVARELPPELQLQGLMHDAAEAYLTDVARPIKAHLSNYKIIEAKLLRCIGGKYGINALDVMPPEVLFVDNLMLSTERQLLPPPPFPWCDLPEPLDMKIECWDWKFARRAFIEMFDCLTDGKWAMEYRGLL